MPTQEEVLKLIVAAVREAERRILPARLADPCTSGANGHLIAAYIQKHKLDVTLADSYSQAIKELFQTLEWVVKPAKLVLLEKNDAPALQENPLKLEAQRAAAVKAGEIAAAKAKANAASLEEAKSLIDGYAPEKHTRRGSSIDYVDQEKAQTYWNALLKQVEAGKSITVERGGHNIAVTNLQDFVVWLQVTREQRYKDRERLAERM